MNENIEGMETDSLNYLFIKARESLLTEADALKNDLTQTFENWIKEKINAGELIVVGLRGEIRTGKSSVEIAVVWMINKYITEIGLNPKALEYMWKWIFSDQTEFLRFINGTERNIGLGIDEFNSLAKTGANSTTETALLDHYSDVFAGQYLHRVSSGTDGIADKNTTVILDVMGKDKEKRTTMCKLVYRDIITKQQMTLGYVVIDVSQLVKNWIDKGIKEIVETKGIQTQEDEQKVNKYKKEDFYVKYQVKKFRRMELLKKEGVRDIRELEFSDIILDCILELQEYSKTQKCDRELINTIVDEVIRTHKRIYSMIAKNEIAQKVSAILGINTKINGLYGKLKAKKKTIGTSEELIINKSIKQLKQILEKRIKEQEHLRTLYKQYLEIEQ